MRLFNSVDIMNVEHNIHIEHSCPEQISHPEYAQGCSNIHHDAHTLEHKLADEIGILPKIPVDDTESSTTSSEISLGIFDNT